jgi:hypothetical protein
VLRLRSREIIGTFPGRGGVVALAVNSIPIADVAGWRQFVEEVSTGERSNAHAEMLRRFGVTREHIFQQSTPHGDVMVLVWEGVEQEDAAAAFNEIVQNPQSEHERYITSHVVPNLHGVDPSAGPPPPVEKVAVVET